MLSEDEVKEIIASFGGDRRYVMRILQEVQRRVGYLPKENLKMVAELLDVPLAKVYGVATFFHQFRLRPHGRHIVQFCFGTACYVKGNDKLWEWLRRKLGLKPGEDTTADLRFTLQKVRCFGCCSMAPVIKVDGDIYGNMTKEKLEEVLRRYA